MFFVQIYRKNENFTEKANINKLSYKSQSGFKAFTHNYKCNNKRWCLFISSLGVSDVTVLNMSFLHVYKNFILPCMKYSPKKSSHEFFITFISTFLLIDFCLVTDCLESLTFDSNVARSTFLHRYFQGYCFSELANCMLPLFSWPRCTRLWTYSHHYSACLNQYIFSFTPLSINFMQSFLSPSVLLFSKKMNVSKGSRKTTWKLKWVTCLYFVLTFIVVSCDSILYILCVWLDSLHMKTNQ